MDRDLAEEQLVKEIKEAFADIPYPGDDNLIPDKIVVNGLIDMEILQIEDELRGKHWTELTDELLSQLRWTLSNLKPEAYRFYLPGCLLASLRGDNLMQDIFVFMHLHPGEEQGSRMDEFLNRIRGFTPQQKTVIKSYVRHFVDGETYLSSGWERAGKFWENY